MNPLVNITIPVYNEERVLRCTVQRLTEFLGGHVKYPWEIVITNNASTDGTLDLAYDLQEKHPWVKVCHLAEKGRGRALKKAWMESEADILTYMDCDLSTDLNCFEQLIGPLLDGTHDISVGSRLLAGAKTTRGFKRSFISKSYNRLIKCLFETNFSDAQCGFKAITKAAFNQLHALVLDNEWFFDTELLLVAAALNYRIHDLPVEWVDDPDSKVRILKTVMQDVKGLIRVRHRLKGGLRK